VRCRTCPSGSLILYNYTVQTALHYAGVLPTWSHKLNTERLETSTAHSHTCIISDGGVRVSVTGLLPRCNNRYGTGSNFHPTLAAAFFCSLHSSLLFHPQRYFSCLPKERSVGRIINILPAYATSHCLCLQRRHFFPLFWVCITHYASSITRCLFLLSRSQRPTSN